MENFLGGDPCGRPRTLSVYRTLYFMQYLQQCVEHTRGRPRTFSVYRTLYFMQYLQQCVEHTRGRAPDAVRAIIVEIDGARLPIARPLLGMRNGRVGQAAQGQQ